MTTQQQHTALSNQLDRALQEALDKPGPSCLKKQGGGDREPTPGPQGLKQGKLNLATEKWFLEPNKVRFMDEPDTYRANVGRHREPQPRLVRAKTYSHLVFADPDRETSPRERRAARNPAGEASKATPDSPGLPSRKNQAWRCLRHSLCHLNLKWWWSPTQGPHPPGEGFRL